MGEITPFLNLGVGGALTVLVISLWRRDIRESEKRYAELATDFRTIVQDNTAALTRLLERLDRFDCPMQRERRS